MIKKISKYLLISSIIIGATNSLAETQINNKVANVKTTETISLHDIKEQNNMVKAVPQYTNNVEESLKDYLKNKGLKTGLNNTGKDKGKGKYIVINIATVSKGVNDKRFRDSVSLAYEKAYFGAQKKLAMQIFGKNMSDKAITLFQNDSDNVEEDFKQKLYDAKTNHERLNTIWGKIVKLTNVKLDKELESSGFPKNKLKNLPIQKKQVLYKQSFMKTIAEEFTAKNLIGTTPIYTAFGMYNGAPAVGIVMMKTDKTAIVASDIANQRKPRISKAKGRNPMDLLPKENKDYLKEFGTRLFFDENGSPAIISYAQKGVFSRSDKPSRKAKAIESAKRKASMLADSQISEFVGIIMSASDKSTQGEKESTILRNRLNKVSGDEEIIEETTDTLIDILQETANSSSQMDLAGISEIYNWQVKDNLGKEVVGVVKLWSYSQLAAANRIKSGKDIRYNTTKSERKAMKIETQTSKDVVNVDDF